ncbi:hypothetical protein TNCV_4308311 [Trichonephila clavipes]|nr:hypothetical protein TNCV_4308311 [Trichonephila clavipes]
MVSCNGKEPKYYEVNTRLSYAMRCIDTAVETVATVSRQIAAKEAKHVSGHSDIPIAIDGTWQKHGHTSLNGAAIVTIPGDSRAYKAVNEMQPYGDTGIEKLEYVDYTEKWMETRLRALKLKIKGKELSDKNHWMITVDSQTLKLINYSVIMDWLSETIPIVLIQ